MESEAAVVKRAVVKAHLRSKENTERRKGERERDGDDNGEVFRRFNGMKNGEKQCIWTFLLRIRSVVKFIAIIPFLGDRTLIAVLFLAHLSGGEVLLPIKLTSEIICKE